jgi:SAM-dependent methyltransferase
MKFFSRIKKFLIQLLRIERIRFLVVKYRYLILKKNMKFYGVGSESISKKTVEYNLTAFNTDSGFGCGQRMGLLIYPVVGFYTSNRIDKSKIKVLIVGARTEDDIFWMRSYGFKNTFGLDLFSYSKYVLLGDIHKTDFQNENFDVILLGWMIAYSKDPKAVIKECRRILKPGGLLGIGIDYVPIEDTSTPGIEEIPNNLNSSKDIIDLLDANIKHKVIFEYDHYNEKKGDHGTAVVTLCK